jgi:hypothetical protein
MKHILKGQPTEFFLLILVLNIFSKVPSLSATPLIMSSIMYF